MSGLFRVLDANSNRSVEAVRVIEEYYRLICPDKEVSLRLKNFRHALLGLVAKNISKWRASRNVAGDMVKFRDIYSDCSDVTIVEKNFSRLKESLRVLEEYLKISDVARSMGIRKLRFEAYELEQSLLSRIYFLRSKVRGAKVYVLLSTEYYKTDRQFIGLVKQVVKGFPDLVQFRDKRMGDRKKVRLLKSIKKICNGSGVPLLVNDRADICLTADCDGVHVGGSDLDIKDVRKLIGGLKIIGKTAHGLADILESNKDSSDYVSYGTFFASYTKPRPVLEKRQWTHVKRARKPLFAIGGIGVGKIKEIQRYGIKRIAVCSGVLATRYPAKAVRDIKKML